MHKVTSKDAKGRTWLSGAPTCLECIRIAMGFGAVSMTVTFNGVAVYQLIKGDL